jgi:lysophospholipase L1-like esterase
MSPVQSYFSSAASAVRILALGDSYTIGESVLPAERWPEQLAARLRERGLKVDEPHIIARTGWTTDELADAIAQADISEAYDLVTLLIGVNNQYRGRALSEYQLQFADLLARAAALTGGRSERVLVLSIPDWGVTPFGCASGRPDISSEIDAFNAANCLIAQQAGVRYVDITPISRQAVVDPGLIAADGLHPSARMYAEWVQAVLLVLP